MAHTPRIVIVGAGEAGARAASALRESGFTGSGTLLGEEPHLPYERPPLSKAAMTSEDDPRPTTILDEARCRDTEIVHRALARVTSLAAPKGHAETRKRSAAPRM